MAIRISNGLHRLIGVAEQGASERHRKAVFAAAQYFMCADGSTADLVVYAEVFNAVTFFVGRGDLRIALA